MAYYTGYNGAVKEVTQLPTGYNGAVVQANGLYCGHQGAKSLVFGRYRWEKWDTKIEKLYELVRKNGLGTDPRYFKFHTDYKINQSLGTVSLSGESISAQTVQEIDNAIKSGYVWTKNTSVSADEQQKTILYVNSVSDINGPFMSTRQYYVELVDKIHKGDNMIGIVQSDNPYSYPDDGEKDGAWYVKIQ